MPILMIKSMDLSLEDIFLQITENGLVVQDDESGDDSTPEAEVEVGEDTTVESEDIVEEEQEEE